MKIDVTRLVGELSPGGPACPGLPPSSSEHPGRVTMSEAHRTPRGDAAAPRREGSLPAGAR
jgi:hypothetical protein